MECPHQPPRNCGRVANLPSPPLLGPHVTFCHSFSPHLPRLDCAPPPTPLTPKVLVLDLDHTILNSVRLSDVSREDEPKLQSILEQVADRGPRRLLYCLRCVCGGGVAVLPQVHAWSTADVGHTLLCLTVRSECR